MATAVCVQAIFCASLLVSLAYVILYRAGASGFGRSFLLLTLAICGATLEPTLRIWIGLRRGSHSDTVLSWIELIALIAALLALCYLLTAQIVWPAVTRNRAFRDERQERYLSRIPYASAAETAAILETWRQQNRPLSGDGVGPAGPTHPVSKVFYQQVLAIRHRRERAFRN